MRDWPLGHPTYPGEFFMLEELREEEIVNKVGGRFKLSTLIQKRLLQLQRGSRPLVETNLKDNMKIVLQEILQDKIFLDQSNNLRTVSDLRAPGEGMELDFGE
jgi:DNA-directed RNA polymerase subunit omega